MAKKQQQMLLKESNKAVKKTKIGARTKANSAIGQSGNMRRKSYNESSDVKRKNKSQSPRSHQQLA